MSRQKILESLLASWGIEEKVATDYVFRISDIKDFERVQTYGSSRCGLSDKVWAEKGSFPDYVPSKMPAKHDQFIIASSWNDIMDDAKYDDGTLAHKLKIYEKPFFTVYKKECLREVGKEAGVSQFNQGTHFEFLTSPKEALDSLWPIADLKEVKATRYYFALTNFCNRACELCSCHSDPSKGTHMTFEQFTSICHTHPGEVYEAQLEGGEPTIHADFWKMVDYLNQDPLCVKIILCTNAVTMPLVLKDGYVDEESSVEKTVAWIAKFKKPFILKPSVNSHLIEHGKYHMKKMSLIKKAMDKSQNPLHSLIYNVRRIPVPMTKDGDVWITDEMKSLGLYEYANDFEYQRYGKGKGEEGLTVPFVVQNPVRFYLLSPDGKNFQTDLIARADYMEGLK